MDTPKKKSLGIFKRLSQMVRSPRSPSTLTTKSLESSPTQHDLKMEKYAIEKDEEWMQNLRNSVEESYRLAEQELEHRYVAEKNLAKLRKSYLDLAIRYSELQRSRKVQHQTQPVQPFNTPQMPRYRQNLREAPPPYRSRSSTASSYRRTPQPEPGPRPASRLYETDL